jgi:type I restriction enzyme R subunit
LALMLSVRRRSEFGARGEAERRTGGAILRSSPTRSPRQVSEELIQPAKDICAARARREETGLSDDEIAFYDAHAD